jgi:hypothetical protein
LQSHLHTFFATIKNTEIKYVSASEVTEKLRFISRENQDTEQRNLSSSKNIITDLGFGRRWSVTESEYIQTELILRHFS